jgi:glutamate---cysteine ligase / carboxylate-amine ligase
VAPYAVAVCEEVMVVEPTRWGLIDDLGALVLPPSLRRCVTTRADGAALVVRTGFQPTADAAVAELAALRGRVTAAVGRDGLRVAAAGAHPEHHVTFGLQVDVAIADAHRAELAHERLRAHLPLLLALAANAPFRDGAETGRATVRAQDPEQDLHLASDRLTVTVCDAQTRVADAGALAALVQSLTRMEATRRRPHRHEAAAPAIDRDRAARAGLDPQARDHLARLLAECAPHANALRAQRRLEATRELAAHSGAQRQRVSARLRPGERSGGRRLRALTAALSAAYSA